MSLNKTLLGRFAYLHSSSFTHSFRISQIVVSGKLFEINVTRVTCAHIPLISLAKAQGPFVPLEQDTFVL